MSETEYEILGFRYAVSGVFRAARDNFVLPPSGDPNADMPMDYFVWAIRWPGGSVVIDTGFGEIDAKRRKRTLLAPLGEQLRAHGMEPNTVSDVLMTHLHYDHAGQLDLFPSARFHVQDKEMAFATGRYMRHPLLRDVFSAEHIAAMVNLVFQERVEFHDGDWTFRPGISLHLVGGHSAGLQIVRVKTARGYVVLAVDATHFAANMGTRNPFPLVFHVGDMLESWGKVQELADGPDRIVPGHDPMIWKRYPKSVSNGVEVVRLDLPPEV